MPSGGARVNSGPPPDPNALRRDRPEDKSGWTILPAEGRTGAVPEWPLPADIHLSTALEIAIGKREVLEAQIEADEAPKGSVAKLAKLDQTVAEIRKQLELAEEMEISLWAQLWVTPQAVAWDQLKWTREVALYVRLQVAAEFGNIEAGKEARQWSDRLGLNPTALLRNRWKIAAATGAAEPTTPTRTRTPSKARQAAKDRLGVIDGGKST